ncbi:hypothetical protein SAMN06893096_101116 [Geodermatophilus pulveris]|uniref:Uncharacterized protein n=1 Tax=Geodermatophilus pulveris TaxID=1564159 RepID=A0A239ANT2_9ACTN|nr:hypothetical protein [Geodermatophilus pulveris]SNR96962.1 hypothetical protein SAMN06893096_101116 [Geodermatophilus pulveris]
MGRHSAPEGAAVDPVVAAALARRRGEPRSEGDGSGLGWPGSTTTHEGLGWPGGTTDQAGTDGGRPQRRRGWLRRPPAA